MTQGQPSLFGDDPPTRALARRRAQEMARARADRGIDRAAAGAERAHAGWCIDAIDALRTFAASQHGMFLIEDARTVIEPNLPPCSDLRAWGRVVQEASRLGYIEKTKLTAPAASSNATQKPLWRRGKAAAEKDSSGATCQQGRLE